MHCYVLLPQSGGLPLRQPPSRISQLATLYTFPAIAPAIAKEGIHAHFARGMASPPGRPGMEEEASATPAC